MNESPMTSLKYNCRALKGQQGSIESLVEITQDNNNKFFLMAKEGGMEIIGKL